MDPNACFDMMTASLEAEDWQQLAVASAAMAEWLAKGGFPPTNWSADGAFAHARDMERFALAKLATLQATHDEVCKRHQQISRKLRGV